MNLTFTCLFTYVFANLNIDVCYLGHTCSCKFNISSGSRGGGGAPFFSPNTLKSPLNWVKFTKKILVASPQYPVRPLSSDPGSATEYAVKLLNKNYSLQYMLADNRLMMVNIITGVIGLLINHID